MISLKNTIEKIKSLQAEKKNLMLEMEELNKTANAKAAALEREVSELRDKVNSLKKAMSEGEADSNLMVNSGQKEKKT